MACGLLPGRPSILCRIYLGHRHRCYIHALLMDTMLYPILFGFVWLPLAYLAWRVTWKLPRSSKPG